MSYELAKQDLNRQYVGSKISFEEYECQLEALKEAYGY
jgi:hypothetical protein